MVRCSPTLALWFLFGWASTAADTVDFSRDVAPIFQKRCIACHGPAMQMNGVRLDDGDAALKGGYSGAIIVPGNSAASKLLERVLSDRKGFMMPPAGPKLSPGEVATLRDWIDSGARWPASAKKAAADTKPAHWAFQPVRKPALPAVENRAWPRNPIDHFVLARLEAEGIEPAPEADKLTLLRRVKFDLVGLPPTPQEAREFLLDNRPDAYEQLVERLLASPHHGERWARSWLDVARYADSDGYEKDQVRAYAWRYRHWVIDALNRDLPFDQFTIEQIAGDLLPGSSTEQKVATGFHRNTLTNREAGVSRAEARFEQVVDRANTVGQGWLGLTVGCAQCHDHKYDPISSKEFYQLYAFFNSQEDVQIPAPLPGELGSYLRARPEYDRKRRELLAEYRIPQLQAEWEAQLRQAIAHPGKDLEFDFALTSMRAMFDGADKILLTAPEKRTERDAERLTDYFISTPGPANARNKELSAKFKELRGKLAELRKALPELSEAMVLAEDPTAPKTRMAVRGDYRNPGIEVEPGTPAVLPPLPQGPEPPRLRLARWLVSRENPLTPRVTVNRVWQEYFGRGLVRTAEDFGTQGERPTHPELLDWLAAEFRDRQWSMKQLHRLIVTSATYRQSSQSRPDVDARDPDNALLARQKRLRLPAELIRDAALASSGLLYPVIGGKSIRPPIPPGVVELGYANSVKWEETTGPERYRRGLYIHFQRTTPYPQLMNFDAPDSNVACSRRRRSNTPLQALNLLNDPVFYESAQALALRVLTEAPRAQDRLDFLFEVTLGRKPTARERERMARYLDLQRTQPGKDARAAGEILPARPEGTDPVEAAAWVGASRVVLNLDEFITRE